MSEYPTEQILRKIHKWDIVDSGPDDLVELIRSEWHWPEWGFKYNRRRLELHTGGWSGNEDIIVALQGTMFWFLYWMKSFRGGHYYFHIKNIRKSK